MGQIADRETAGHDLAEAIHRQVTHLTHGVVLAIPRGGVVVGAAIAEDLGLPLWPLITKKIGAPGDPEYAIGAVMPDGTPMLAPASARWQAGELAPVVQAALANVRAYQHALLGELSLPALTGTTIILVDDGIATGATVQAALDWLTRQKPDRIILAVPVIAADTADRLRPNVDHLIALLTPINLETIGTWYDDFQEVSTATAKRLLDAQPDGPAPVARQST